MGDLFTFWQARFSSQETMKMEASVTKMPSIWKKGFSYPFICQNHIFTSSTPPDSVGNFPKAHYKQTHNTICFMARHTCQEMKDDPEAEHVVQFGAGSNTGRVHKQTRTRLRSQGLPMELPISFQNNFGTHVLVILGIIFKVFLRCVCY